MDTTSAPAGIDVLFGSDPTPASPPVAVPASPELAPSPVPVGPDPNIPADPSQVPPPAPVAQPPATPEPPRQPTPTVPLPELLEQRHKYQAERARADAIEQQNRQLMEMLQRMQQPPQPQPQPIDPLAEPERAYQALQQKLAEQEHALRTLPQAIHQQVQADMLNEKLNMSEASARSKHGDDLVSRAQQAAVAQGLAPSFRNQADPYGSLISWYQADQLAREVGADPNAYRARIAAEERQRIIAEMRQGQRPSNIPPSITAATNSAAAPQAVVSTKDFFNAAMNEPLRKR